METIRYEGLDLLPFYRETLDAAGVDPRVDAFRAVVRSADVVVMVTPEHNGLPSAVMKNALDLASRPRTDAPLAGKPVAVLAASPSPGGGRRAADALVTGLRSAGALPFERVVTIPRAHERLRDGRYDEAVQADVDALLDEVLGSRAAA